MEIKELDVISNPFNNAPVYYIEKTPSTMKLAKEYCSNFNTSADLHGTVIVAGEQTKGRGRFDGRIWVASKDENLLFTLILSKTRISKNPLPILIGLGISKYMENHHKIESTIKWPNDLLVGTRKISGIIVESHNNLFNIGIGININQKEFTNLLADSVTSLAIEKKNRFTLFSELELILYEIKEVLVSKSWHKEVIARLNNLERTVNISTGIPGHGKNVIGIVKGIGRDGQLLLRSKEGPLEIFSGEIKQ